MAGFTMAGKSGREVVEALRHGGMSREEVKVLGNVARVAVEVARLRGEAAGLDALDDGLDCLSGRAGIEPMTWKPELSCDAFCYGVLRFDGGKLDEELQRGESTGSTYGGLAGLYAAHFEGGAWGLHADALVNWGVLFWLQRGAKSGGLDRAGARLAAWLFTQLYDQPVPRGYVAEEWARGYAGLEEEAAALVREWARECDVWKPSVLGGG